MTWPEVLLRETETTFRFLLTVQGDASPLRDLMRGIQAVRTRSPILDRRLAHAVNQSRPPCRELTNLERVRLDVILQAMDDYRNQRPWTLELPLLGETPEELEALERAYGGLRWYQVPEPYRQGRWAPPHPKPADAERHGGGIGRGSCLS